MATVYLAYDLRHDRKVALKVLRPGKWQVSTNGGFAPLWSRDGRELFFVNSRREMTGVPVAPGPSPQLGERKILFTLPNDVYGAVRRTTRRTTLLVTDASA